MTGSGISERCWCTDQQAYATVLPATQTACGVGHYEAVSYLRKWGKWRKLARLKVENWRCGKGLFPHEKEEERVLMAEWSVPKLIVEIITSRNLEWSRILR